MGKKYVLVEQDEEESVEGENEEANNCADSDCHNDSIERM